MTIYFETTERLEVSDSMLETILPDYLEYKKYYKDVYKDELEYGDTLEDLKQFLLESSEAYEFIDETLRFKYEAMVEQTDYAINVYNH